MGTIWFGITGIQNGNPDGIALYNTSTSTLIQFLSYGGTFTASSGVANGILSEDIGTTESGSGASTESLQLTGTGNTYADFTWTSQASSHDLVNPNQTFNCVLNTMTIDAINSTPFVVDCAGSDLAITVDITSTEVFNPGNSYIVELSDASGSFSNPTQIGTISSTLNSETINASIPATLVSGTNYRIRVISTSPVVTSAESSAITVTQTNTCTAPITAGIIVNEWSNGTTGLQEYYEYAVIGECGSTVDIRGFIIDDNNATFTTPSYYSSSSSGIALGHYRFAYNANWASVPVGSIILIYNSNEVNPLIPTVDETDSNADYLYVVPNNSIYLEACLSYPTSSSPDSTYQSCTYAPTSDWAPLNIRNGGDAIQIRNPDGTYYHGVSYGGSEISGGPHELKLFTGSGSGMSGWFNDGDFFDVNNWDSGTAASNQTPGTYNNALNEAWLLEMRDPTSINCPITVLPVVFTLFNGVNKGKVNHIFWQTATERNSDYFVLYNSTDGVNWSVVNKTSAGGHSDNVLNYSFNHINYSLNYNYYKLEQYDFDGTKTIPNNYVVIDNRTVSNKELMKIVNLIGQEVNEDHSGIQIHIYSDGTSEKVFKF